ncbi:MAG TPA: gluconokinase [Gemmatimonadaceae bacterium]
MTDVSAKEPDTGVSQKSHPRPVQVIVVMGVTGAGKTTVGEELAQALHWPFYEGDDFHPRRNIELMSHGTPLTDDDRAPWLQALARMITNVILNGEHAVLACSALRQRYRDELLPRGAPGAVRFVYLDVPLEVLRERVSHRPHHFMPASLLPSQLETLEEPRDALTVDGTRPPTEIVHRVRAELGV